MCSQCMNIWSFTGFRGFFLPFFAPFPFSAPFADQVFSKSWSSSFKMLLCHILFILIHYKYINIYLDWILHWKMLLLGTSGFKPKTKKKKLGNNSPVLLLFGTFSLKGSLGSLWCKNKITSENSKFDNANPEVLRFGFLEVHLVAFLVQSNNFFKRFSLWSYWGKGGMGWSILLGFFNLLIFEVIDFQLKPNFLGLCST